MTLVDKYLLTAALAERDAARAEVARLRAGVEAAVRLASPDDLTPMGAHIIRATLAATEDQP